MIDPITSSLVSALDKVGQAFEVAGGKFLQDVCPDFLKPTVDNVPKYQIEAAAHSACHFFGLPDIPLQEGDGIGVYTFNPDCVDDDVFQYDVDQFHDMKLSSFEDQTKVWTHECGHRILQKTYGNSWASELGSDFFVGIREEMLEIGKSNFERALGETKASVSHPGGDLRLKAIEYGREVAAEMKKNGITPTWENCAKKYAESPFSKMDYANASDSTFSGLFVNSKSFHESEANRCASEANYWAKEANKAAEKGDYAKSKDCTQKSEQYKREAEEHQRSKSQCSQ